MSTNSSAHAYVNWTKQRLDEMDATLASIESEATQLKADAKAKADQIVADLRQRREDFRAKVKAEAEAGENALRETKAQLETQWNGFEAQVRTYFETVGTEIAQQQATFRKAADAQLKAWHEAADKVHGAASQFAAEGRAGIEAAVAQMRADAAEAEARLQQVKKASSESWSALGAALAQSRKAFDEANQKILEALKRATSQT